MAKVSKQTDAPVSPQALYDDLELRAFQSLKAHDLDSVYSDFQSQSTAQQLEVLTAAGPAKIVAFALRGYELPDAAARLHSNTFVLHLFATIKDKQVSESLRQQIRLVFAQQQEILLTLLEQDIEALRHSQLTKRQTDTRQATLALLHKLLRTNAKQAVKQLFGPSITKSTAA